MKSSHILHLYFLLDKSFIGILILLLILIELMLELCEEDIIVLFILLI